VAKADMPVEGLSLRRLKGRDRWVAWIIVVFGVVEIASTVVGHAAWYLAALGVALVVRWGYVLFLAPAHGVDPSKSGIQRFRERRR
jgi:hypothetical protein